MPHSTALCTHRPRHPYLDTVRSRECALSTAAQGIFDSSLRRTRVPGTYFRTLAKSNIIAVHPTACARYQYFSARCNMTALDEVLQGISVPGTYFRTLAKSHIIAVHPTACARYQCFSARCNMTALDEVLRETRRAWM